VREPSYIYHNGGFWSSHGPLGLIRSERQIAAHGCWQGTA